jgi:hypothetical protein
MAEKYSKEHFELEKEKLRMQQEERKAKAERVRSVAELDPQVRKFCIKIAEGKSPSDAALLAGYEEPGLAAKQLMRRPGVKRALNGMIQRTMEISEVTREEVIEGFKDAISIARQQSDAAPMIAGWREIGKMLGMYETKVKVEVTGGGTEIERQLKGMSDADLLALIAKRSSLLEEAIDGEFEEVGDGDDTEEA